MAVRHFRETTQRASAMPKIEFTPNELQTLIKLELRKKRDIPEGLLIQIIRNGGTWHPRIRFKVGHPEAPDAVEIADAVNVIAAQLAPKHPLLG